MKKNVFVNQTQNEKELPINKKMLTVDKEFDDTFGSLPPPLTLEGRSSYDDFSDVESSFKSDSDSISYILPGAGAFADLLSKKTNVEQTSEEHFSRHLSLIEERPFKKIQAVGDLTQAKLNFHSPKLAKNRDIFPPEDE